MIRPEFTARPGRLRKNRMSRFYMPRATIAFIKAISLSAMVRAMPTHDFRGILAGVPQSCPFGVDEVGGISLAALVEEAVRGRMPPPGHLIGVGVVGYGGLHHGRCTVSFKGCKMGQNVLLLRT